MTETALETRLLVLAPTGRDGPLTCELLQKAELPAVLCANVEELCREIERGCAGVLLTEETMQPKLTLQLVAVLNQQPAWSDLPLVVFTGEGATHPGLTRLLRTLGNVTVLDRPVRPVSMISASRAMMRARRRQYQARAELLVRDEAVRHRDQFLAMLGHELRNPLSALRLAAELLNPATREDEHRLDIIVRQGAHLSQLVDELLDVARVTSGKVTVKHMRVHLDEIATRVVDTFQPSAERAGVELVCERTPGNASVVIGDPTRLEQVLTNLVGNSLKYTLKGGHVRVQIDRDVERVTVVVRDDGVGLSEAELARVFELFAQVDTSLDRSLGGLGIGLTLSRALVELHGGELRAESDGTGKGATFTIVLPAAAAEPEAPVVAASAPAKAAKHRVVLVEDSDDVRELTAMVMEAAGHAVTTAADGQEGVRLIVDSRPDVAFIDVGLPLIDGFEVARRVRAELGADVVLIALTGYGQPEDQRRAFDAGFDLHMVKPLDSKRVRGLLALEHAAFVAEVHAQAAAARSS